MTLLTQYTYIVWLQHIMNEYIRHNSGFIDNRFLKLSNYFLIMQLCLTNLQ